MAEWRAVHPSVSYQHHYWLFNCFGGTVWLWSQWYNGLLRKNAHDASEAYQKVILAQQHFTSGGTFNIVSRHFLQRQAHVIQACIRHIERIVVIEKLLSQAVGGASGNIEVICEAI